MSEEIKRIFADHSNDFNDVYNIYFSQTVDKFIVRQPIEMYGGRGMGYVYDENEYTETAIEIKEFLQEVTLPLLERCNTLDGFIEEFERENKRTLNNNEKQIAFDKRVTICVIAAYMLKGKRDKGFEVLNKYFNKKGLQNIYKPLLAAYS